MFAFPGADVFLHFGVCSSTCFQFLFVVGEFDRSRSRGVLRGFNVAGVQGMETKGMVRDPGLEACGQCSETEE